MIVAMVNDCQLLCLVLSKKTHKHILKMMPELFVYNSGEVPVYRTDQSGCSSNLRPLELAIAIRANVVCLELTPKNAHIFSAIANVTLVELRVLCQL